MKISLPAPLQQLRLPALSRLPGWLHGLSTARLLALAGCLLAMAAALEFRYAEGVDLRRGLLLMGAGAALLLPGLQGLKWWPDAVAQRVRGTAAAQPLNRGALLAGAALLLFLLQINALNPQYELFGVEWLAAVPHDLQALLLLLSCWLLLRGLGGVRAPEVPAGGRPGRHTAVGLVFLLAAALFMRLFNLEYGLHRYLDEIHYADAVVRLWARPQQILAPFSDLTAFSWLFPQVQAWAAPLVGGGLTGLRVVSAAFGMAQLGALYFLGVTLFDRKTALIAAVVLAGFPLHVHFSRIGINNIADPVFGTLALAFLARGFQRGQQRDFVLAGLMLGLTAYFYEGGRLFYLPFALCWVGWLALLRLPGFYADAPLRTRRLLFDALLVAVAIGLPLLVGAALLLGTLPALLLAGGLLWGGGLLWLERRRERLQEPLITLRALLLALLAAALLLGPLYYTWFAHQRPFVPRLEAMGVQDNYWVEILVTPANPLLLLLERAAIPLLGFIQIPDSSWFYGGEHGFVLPLLVPFFLLGAVLVLLRIHRPGGSLLFWWVVGTAAGNLLIVDNLSAPRYLVALPAVALLVALGIRTLWRLSGLEHWRGGRPGRVLLGALLVLITLYQFVYYFGFHLPGYYVQMVVPQHDHNYEPLKDNEDALLRAMTLPAGTDVHIVSRGVIWRFNIDTLLNYYGRRDELRLVHIAPEDFDEGYIAQLPAYRHHAFFIEPEDLASFRVMRSYFTAVSASFSPYGIPHDKQLILYFAPYGTMRSELLPESERLPLPPADTPPAQETESSS